MPPPYNRAVNDILIRQNPGGAGDATAREATPCGSEGS